MPRIRRILVAEADDDLREIIASFLEADGWSVVAVGVDTATARHAKEFSAAIVDVRSITSTGLSLLGSLRARAAALPVVVITSFGDAFVRRLVQQQDSTVVLEKPFELEELRRALEGFSLDNVV